MSKQRYTLSMMDSHLSDLRKKLASEAGHERAAYLYCSRAVMPGETRLIVRSVKAIPEEFIKSSSADHVSISDRSYVPAVATAARRGLSIILVHSHPNGYSAFSRMDDLEEPEFFRVVCQRVHDGTHGSLIVCGTDSPDLVGRVWVDGQGWTRMDMIRVVGRRMRVFLPPGVEGTSPAWADRQVRAFGESTQRLLGSLNVGVVGVGGTGSAVCEQLIRLGVGHLTVLDEQELEDTNVNRLYGANISDAGSPKVCLVERQAARIGTGTVVTPVKGTIYDRAIAEVLRSCDVVFSCTDDHFGRAILNRLAVWYYIPVIDMAVAIDSTEGIIREVTGRVTVLMPGSACLHCRGRVDQGKMRAEMLMRIRPVEYWQRVKEGYAPELGQIDPAVVMFTTGVAARAVTELVQLLTGFMGDDRMTSEVLERFHVAELGRNDRSGQQGCYCASPERWGYGDQERFLDLNW